MLGPNTAHNNHSVCVVHEMFQPLMDAVLISGLKLKYELILALCDLNMGLI